ncbi:MAG: FlgD immunoglobulin-like domain containing protein, partial [Calditrichia bacterium]
SESVQTFHLTGIIGGLEISSQKLTKKSPLMISDPRVKKVRIRRGENVPLNFVVCQNYPNPFNPLTEIKYSLPERSKITITIYNLLGQVVKTLFDGTEAAGQHRITWNGTDRNGISAPSGVYFYRVTAGEFNVKKKMILLR